MLGKILKYDLKWIFKQALYLYPILLVDVLLIAILPEHSESNFIDFLRGFAEGVYAGFIAVFFVTTLKLAWTRMSRNMYGDEAYLTRTLPTSIGTIFSAKVLAGIIFLLTNIVFCLVATTIAYPDLWSMISEFSGLIFMPTFLVILVAFVTFFVQGLFLMMAGFLGITIGYRFRNQHFTWSAVIGAGIYFIGGALLVVAELIISACFNENLLNFFIPYRSNDPISAVRDFFLIAMTGYVIYNIGCYIAGRLLQKRGADID